MAKTTKKVSVLSIGSDSRPCWRTAVREVRAGLLEGRHEEVRARAGDAAEDDGRDRGRDDRRDDAADQPGHEDVGRAQVAPHEQQGEQPDDGGDEQRRDRPAEDDEDGRRGAPSVAAKNVTPPSV